MTSMSTAGLIATWFRIGHIPKAPGTFGSLAALPMAWLLVGWGGHSALLAGIVIVTLVGIWAAGRHEAELASPDPGSIVVDEVAGQMLALLTTPLDLGWYLVGFALFRLFDIWKPGPIRWMDRTVKGGWGIMLDDLLAGCLAQFCLYGIINVVG